MNAPLVAKPAGSLDQSSAPETRLRGRWLRLSRLGWVVVTLTLIALNLLALPDSYRPYFTLPPQILPDLHRLGLAPTLYSLLLLVEHASIQLGFLALGLLLFVRRSADRMALFCALMLVTFGNATALFDYSSGSIVPILAAYPVLRVLALVLFAMGIASSLIFFYLFPSGRFAPRWTRWVALVVALYQLAVVFFPTLDANANANLTAFVYVIALVLAVVAQVYRYRRISTQNERHQTKWAIFGPVLWVLVVVTGTLLSVLIPSLQNDPVLFSLNPTFTTASLLIPIFLTIAVWRGRLWDIDALINKALVYGSATVLLGALYAGLIVGLESLAGRIAGPAALNPLVLVVSTLVIAALFLPVRRRIQAVIDRRFYRRKYDAEQTLAAFSAMLRSEVDLEQIRERLLTVVQETMQPTQVSLWLRQPARRSTEQAHRLDPRGPGEGLEDNR